MTSENEKLNNEALELFGRSLDQPSNERKSWIATEAKTTAIRDKALKYLSLIHI